MTDLVALLEPVHALAPTVASPGTHPLSALLTADQSDLTGLLVANAPTLVDAALRGTAGTAAVGALGDAGRNAATLLSQSGELEEVAAEATAAVQRAAVDIADIAADCLRDLVPAVAAAPLSPATPAVALQIAGGHLVRAHARLDALGTELDELTGRVEQIGAALPAPPPLPGTPPELSATEVPTSSDTGSQPMSQQITDSDDDGGDGIGNTETVGAPTPEAAAAVTAAKSALGTPYAWGGTTPGVGLDCSGLTQWAYAQAGVDIPRTADQQAVGPQVPADQLAPGDLVVWDGHVAMVTGDGQMIEAGDPVQISSIRTENIGMTFLGFYRPTG
ncbi:MAG TPA: C40 family peptidase [Candidatus Corynebacterium avicola]|uniref:C40 family peptidase n=1 Tax=Candidatus Corynebacterium avicola TaxID=2838527 RepID=A0A9D1ULE9_9CORY|nr:C40 family peptidase [Candidatus Corynebacterium avicola]